MKYSKILSDILVTTGLAILVSTFLGVTITSFGAAARRFLLTEGYNYYCTKDFDKAEKLWKLSSLFPVSPSDEIRMKTASWLGVMYLEQGRYHAAEKILAPELRRRSYLFGDRNLWTAAAEDYLGGCYFEQKRYAEARALYSHCLLVRKELLGSEHLETLCSMEQKRETRAIRDVSRATPAQKRAEAPQIPSKRSVVIRAIAQSMKSCAINKEALIRGAVKVARDTPTLLCLK